MSDKRYYKKYLIVNALLIVEQSLCKAVHTWKLVGTCISVIINNLFQINIYYQKYVTSVYVLKITFEFIEN